MCGCVRGRVCAWVCVGRRVCVVVCVVVCVHACLCVGGCLCVEVTLHFLQMYLQFILPLIHSFS